MKENKKLNKKKHRSKFGLHLLCLFEKHYTLFNTVGIRKRHFITFWKKRFCLCCRITLH